jgi:hypothetical protein
MNEENCVFLGMRWRLCWPDGDVGFEKELSFIDFLLTGVARIVLLVCEFGVEVDESLMNGGKFLEGIEFGV